MFKFIHDLFILLEGKIAFGRKYQLYKYDRFCFEKPKRNIAALVKWRSDAKKAYEESHERSK